MTNTTVKTCSSLVTLLLSVVGWSSVLVLSDTAIGQIPQLLLGSGAPTRHDDFTVDQVVIPRYYRTNPNSYPAGPLPPGRYIATSETAKKPVPAVILSEDYGRKIGQWQSGNSPSELLPAVLGIRIRDVIVDGSLQTPNAGILPTYPSFDGIRLDSHGARVESTSVVRVPGTGISAVRRASSRQGGVLAHDSAATRLRDVETHYTLRGIHLGGADGELNNAHAHGFWEWGIKIDNASQAADLHAWGGMHPESIGVLISGSRNLLTRVYSENVPVGLRIEGNNNQIQQVRTHTCGTGDIQISGRRNILSSFEVQARATGIFITGQCNNLAQGDISLRATNAVGMHFGNGNGQRLEGVLIYGQAHAGTTGIVVDATLNRTIIDVQCVDCEVGIDLVGPDGRSRLGTKNSIRLISHNTRVPIRLPKTWEASNFIEVNGVRMVSEK